MFNSDEISEREHLDFIQQLAHRRDCSYWAVIINGEILGGVSIQDIRQQEAKPGIFMRDTGMGMGAAVAYYALNHYFCSLGLQRLIAHVLKGNHDAMQMNLQFGYVAAPQYTIQRGDKIFCGLELTVEAWKTRQSRFERIVNLSFPVENVTWDDVYIK